MSFVSFLSELETFQRKWANVDKSQDLASKGVSAEKWSATVAEVIGGKAGGKDPTRQGAGTKPEKLDEAVKVAEKWLEDEMAKLKV